ncbi:MAG: RNA polymerase sigma factor [Eggerthellaceae bacterium]|nr:RNA polymerase sigma factor [Eggerthellaceae bacterium]
MRQSDDIERTMKVFADAVWRLCVMRFVQHPDAQDAFQETFLRYALADGVQFQDDEHRKAWLLRVATNVCNDMCRKRTRHPESPMDESLVNEMESCDEYSQPSSARSEIIDAMRVLGDPPRTELYLSLVEGYTAPEIAEMTGSPVNTVYSWISRGKKQLREALA